MGFNSRQLKIGTRIEMEHTGSRWFAQKIAMDHLNEFPNYYSELIKMERRLKQQSKR